MKMSRARPPKEIGSLIEEETVSSWVLVQKKALPRVWISVPAAWRSSAKARTVQFQIDADRRDDDRRQVIAVASVGRRRRVDHRPDLRPRVAKSAHRLSLVAEADGD
jgi:hypothetical protein